MSKSQSTDIGDGVGYKCGNDGDSNSASNCTSKSQGIEFENGARDRCDEDRDDDTLHSIIFPSSQHHILITLSPHLFHGNALLSHYTNPNPNPSASMDGVGVGVVTNERTTYELKGYFNLAKEEIAKAMRAKE
ncbi:hypothetical protein Droror1_Dr00025137 [Drosera rotundifolia]